MAQNPALGGNLGAESAATDLMPITPNDDTDLAVAARAIRCKPNGGAGTLRFTSHTGTVRNTYIDVGETLMVIATRVHASGTTATGLEAYV